MPATSSPPIYISASVFAQSADTVKQVIAQAQNIQRKHPTHMIFAQESKTRQGDFIITGTTTKLTIDVAYLVAFPGPGKSPIITTVLEPA
jgi:hypothetical protein